MSKRVLELEKGRSLRLCFSVFTWETKLPWCARISVLQYLQYAFWSSPCTLEIHSFKISSFSQSLQYFFGILPTFPWYVIAKYPLTSLCLLFYQCSLPRQKHVEARTAKINSSPKNRTKKLLPAQKPATCNLPKFPTARFPNQPNWAGKLPIWQHCLQSQKESKYQVRLYLYLARAC